MPERLNARLREHDIVQRSHPRLEGPQFPVLLPEFLQLIFQVELASQLEKQTVIPLLGREVLADRCEVEGGDGNAFLPEASGGAVHEGGLAHLAAGEDVTELAV